MIAGMMLTVIRHRLAWCLLLLWLCAAFPGCSSLPEINPDMSTQSEHSIQLTGANGPLNQQKSQAVIEKIKSRSPETNIFDRHLALEESVAGSPLTLGNKVVLLQDGPTTFEHMFRAIQAAKHYIHMETYIIEDDEVGNRFVNALVEKQQQGVQVYLIYDSVGSIGTPSEFFKRLSDSGAKVLEFNPVNPLTASKGWEVNQRDHRKLLVVDGEIAFLGGINISSVYSSSALGKREKHRSEAQLPWRDTHVQLEGPVVAEFVKMFATTWAQQKGEPMAPVTDPPLPANKGREVVRAIASSPDDPYSQIYVTLISAINSAEVSVNFTIAYFVPDPQLIEALKAAVRRGVDVKIILPGKTDSSLVFYAARSYYADLIEAGIKIYERRDALLHSKTAVVDGVWSTIGSTNLDWRSFLHNQEINAVILGPEFADQMQAMFDKDLAASERITPQQWGRRSLMERLKEMGARIWAYWL